jgi:hypothetical protein
MKQTASALIASGLLVLLLIPGCEAPPPANDEADPLPRVLQDFDPTAPFTGQGSATGKGGGGNAGSGGEGGTGGGAESKTQSADPNRSEPFQGSEPKAKPAHEPEKGS